MDAARYARQSDPERNRRFLAGYTWNVPDRPPGPPPQNRNRRPAGPRTAAQKIGKHKMLSSTTADVTEQQAIRLAKLWGVA